MLQCWRVGGGNSAEENAVQQQSEEAQEAGEIGFVPGEFPISKEPITIKIMIPITASPWQNRLAI